MEPRKAVGWLAAIAIAVGFILLLVPVSTAAGTGCGSVLNSSDGEAWGEELSTAMSGYGEADATKACGSRRGVQAGIAWGVIGVGALVGGYLMLTSKGKPLKERAATMPKDEPGLA